MAPSFSIREYAASMRGTAASRHPALSAAGDFPPMPIRRFRWWVDELHAAVSRRRRRRSSPAAAAAVARKNSKRSVSDLFAATGEAPAMDSRRRKKPRSQEDDDGVEKMKKKGIFISSTPNAPKTFQVHERQKHINIENMKMYDFEIWKPENSAKVPKNSILRKHTKRSSFTVSINKEKCSNLKGSEAIELSHKLGKHVTFSGVDDIHIRNKLSSTLPQLQNHCNVYSDKSNEADRLVSAKISSHENKEASGRDIYDRWTSESSGAKDPINLIDLNRTLPCIPDFNGAFISGSEVPDLEHTENATSDLQIPGDVREEAVLKHNQDLHSKSPRSQCELNSCDLGRIINLRSIASLLPDEAINISDRGMIGHPLNSTEVNKFYADYERSSVRDDTMEGKAPYILPQHTVQYTSQFTENWYTNMNLGNFHHAGREFSSCPCENQLNSEKPMLHSEINVQHEHAVMSQRTMRLMGKDLTVSTTGGKCIGETAKVHVNSSVSCHHTTNIFLELPRQGHPFLSLQSRSFSNIQVDAPSTSHDYVGYKMHNLKRRFPEADVFSGNGIECEDRLRDFSYLHCGQNALAGFSPQGGKYNTRSDQNSLSATTFLPTFIPHAKQSAVYRANSTWKHNPYPANLLVHPPDGTNFRKDQNQIIRGVAEIPSSVNTMSRDTVWKTRKIDVDNSNISSGVRYISRSGPVKLRPGAKHVLEPRQDTDDGNYPPMYSCVPFFVIRRGGNILSGQTKSHRKV
ncbi:uncharacterized protein [Oryza sativa Japonica Group]|uniref:uncharacterized protein isoform X2 n=1 Tax=Oryza sativa subsp. japonica TaxID=39947 RepID=UPI0007753E9F|nr:uncharacterized protein LOC4338068 isoform X2 [Oryza sativa Japonica Group]KAF2929599.1 hypothetical protein DAI22_05g068500 [Oryza sativa Japonica Group]KAF2929602.1 hypothetical protein DAI22_05g068500 [Oryza sativa Japonica Group]